VRRASFKWALALFALLFVFYSVCPIQTPYDSKWYIPTVLSILREGNINLDEYRPSFSQEHGVIEVRGHGYNDYPLGPALVALPFIAAFDLVVRAVSSIGTLSPRVSRLLERWRHHFDTTGVINLDFWNLPQRIIASVVVALTAVLVYALSVQSLSHPRALLVALLFAIGTSALSTASRALWQHGPSMLFLAGALVCLVKADTSSRWLAPAGVCLALGYVMRPTNSISVLLLSGYVLITFRRQSLWFFGSALTIALPWMILNWVDFGHPLPPYYQLSRFPMPGPMNFIQASLANLFSPSRGLIVFTPVVLFSIVGAISKYRAHAFTQLDWTIALIIVLHWILISGFYVWWAGHSYGPRYFSDVLPYLFYFLIPWVGRIRWRTPGQNSFGIVAFAFLALISCAIHLRGAVSPEVTKWNSTPVEVGQNLARVWDWKDPQFLRGLLTSQSRPLNPNSGDRAYPGGGDI
jgi:hypothetical protein